MKNEMYQIYTKATKSCLSVLRKREHPKIIDAFGWFINILAHLFNLLQIFPSSNFKHQKIVSLSKIRMFSTIVFCQCVKLNLRWTYRGSVSSCFFKQLNIPASSLRQRPITAPRDLVTVLMKTRCLLYVHKEWRVCSGIIFL